MVIDVRFLPAIGDGEAKNESLPLAGAKARRADQQPPAISPTHDQKLATRRDLHVLGRRERLTAAGQTS